MLMSMSLLADALSSYNPETFIRDDALCIRGIRFLAQGEIESSSEYAYFTPVQGIANGQWYSNETLIVSGHSHIVCHDCDYQELLNALMAAFESYRDWEDRLRDAAQKHAPLQTLVDICNEHLTDPIFLSDMDGNILASAEDSENVLRPYWIGTPRDQAISPQTISHPLYDLQGRFVADFTAHAQLLQAKGDEHLFIGIYLVADGEYCAGAIVLLPDKAHADMDMQLVEAVAPLLTQAEEFSSPSAKLQSSVSLLTSLLAGDEVSPTSLERFQSFRGKGPWRLLSFAHSYRVDNAFMRVYALGIKRIFTSSTPFADGERMLVLIRAEDWKDLPEKMAADFDLSHLIMAASMTFTDLHALPAAARQVVFTLERAGATPGFYCCEEFAFDYLMQLFGSQEQTAVFLHPALDILRDYDRRNRGELYKTLQEYLRQDGSMVKTAALLNVHLNTLKYRLKRIQEIAETDMEDADEREYLRISFFLADVGQSQ